MKLNGGAIGKSEVCVQVGGEECISSRNKLLPEARVFVLDVDLFLGEDRFALPTDNVGSPSESM